MVDPESSADSSGHNEEEEDEPIVNNSSRLVSDQAEREANTRRWVGPSVDPVITKEEAHDHKAVFGQGQQGAEVWFGVEMKSRSKGKVRRQFMQLKDRQ